MNEVFITRKLSNNSVIKQYLNNNNISYQADSLISFKELRIRELPTTKWIFFNSSRGARIFFQQLLPQFGTEELDKFKYASIGNPTNQVIKSYGFSPSFEPMITNNKDSGALEVCSQFANHIAADTVTIVRAQESNQTLAKFLDSKNFKNLIAYENSTCNTIEIEPHKIAVITSSKNARFYVQLNQSMAKFVIAIGHQTMKTLEELNMKVDLVPDKPYEEDILISIKKLIHL